MYRPESMRGATRKELSPGVVRLGITYFIDAGMTNGRDKIIQASFELGITHCGFEPAVFTGTRNQKKKDLESEFHVISLTLSPLIAPKTRTASVYRSSDSRSRIDLLLDLPLACLTRKRKPFLLLRRPPMAPARPPDASPTDGPAAISG